MILSKAEYKEGGLILIDKDLTWTSFDVVNKLRYFLKVKKLGHAGTLDPLATGLLILCSGKWTKKINDYQGMPKTYVGELVLGATTPSYDLETEINQTTDISNLSEKDIFNASKNFSGSIQQIPPSFSAIKKDGVRSYQLARDGQDIKLEPRQVEIHEFLIEHIELPKVRFRLTCSKGFYVRSLVRDFGEHLNCGAYMSSLRRTAIGELSVENALRVEEFIDAVQQKENEGLSQS